MWLPSHSSYIRRSPCSRTGFVISDPSCRGPLRLRAVIRYSALLLTRSLGEDFDVPYFLSWWAHCTKSSFQFLRLPTSTVVFATIFINTSKIVPVSHPYSFGLTTFLIG
nr:MAG TPA: hypothetical protein [Caudoviricetes sp.]